MTDKQLDILINIIGGVESGGQTYGCRKYNAYAGPYKNSPEEVTCTLGWCQFYGENARKLCQNIFETDKEAFRAADTANIEKRLSQNWVSTKWSPTAAEKQALIKIITTDVGMKMQDELFKEDTKLFVKDAEAFGITDVGAQMMYCEIRHLGGKTPTERIFKRATKPYTVDTVYSSLLLDQKDTSNNNQVGDKKYQSRHECCVKWIKSYVNKGDVSTSTNNSNNAINSVIAVATNEIGYLEKASNAYLDDKTKNSGSGNYTKYWRDIYPQFQGLAWCACFVTWCFVQAFGKETAKKLLKHYPYTYCPTMKDLFTLNANPKVGDIVIFYRSGEFAHTGIVTKVNGDYFETIEGNASGASGITPNGGGVVKKSYYNSNLPGTKFCTPDYSIVTNSNKPTSVTTPSTSTKQEANTSSSTSSETMLRKGSKGSSVKDLQEKLNKLGYGLVVDGDFGKLTEQAVKKFQTKSNIEVDGIVGPTTLSFLNSAIGKITSSNKVSYMVKITADALNIRANAGTQYPIVGVIKDKGCYTIVDEQNGWGLLKSRVGWISLKYAQKI